jgi:hypothetical protein
VHAQKQLIVQVEHTKGSQNHARLEIYPPVVAEKLNVITDGVWIIQLRHKPTTMISIQTSTVGGEVAFFSRNVFVFAAEGFVVGCAAVPGGNS